ncbi:MAG TPA: carboxypeptidase-like regulatory domain-containing protein, partial [Phnomibacter sp.]|nr:carboxypeptidase-like regulatory domain-containing protein [Phnomibacter sp.]
MLKITVTLVLLIVGLGTFHPLLAQTRITGFVSDGKQPLPFASVSLYDTAGKKMIRLVSTANNGAFEMEGVPAGVYFIGITMVGHMPFESAIFLVEKGSGQKHMG